MEYRLDINEETLHTALENIRDKAFTATVGEHSHEICFERISPHQLHLMVDGRRINAWVEAFDGGKIILIDGERYVIHDRDLAEQNQSRDTGLDTQPDRVTPPMPAIVMAVPAKEGMAVSQGDTLVVVSAMKMETALAAPHDGVVTRVGVAEGDKVMPGEILVDVDPKSQE
ncbi:MAG: hypothetical protein MI747_03660, partial [Desulfobacterales bacterium]|nr:hypothetical protein [Desulfobacterales bacterium]